MRNSEMSVQTQLIQETLDGYYSFMVLKKIAQEYFFKITPKPAEFPESPSQISKLRKDQLLKLMTSFFSTPQQFEALYSIMPQEVKTTFMMLTWGGNYITADELEDLLQKPVKLKVDQRVYYADPHQLIEPAFLIIPLKKYHSSYHDDYGYQFYMPGNLRGILKKYLEKPPDYIPQPEKELPHRLTLFNCDKDILSRFNILYNYIAQDSIRFSTSGNILKSAYKKLADVCGLKEFYPMDEKVLQYLRGELLLNFLQHVDFKPGVVSDPALKIVKLFENFFKDGQYLNFKSQYFVKSHLKGIISDDYRYDKYEMKFRKDFFSLLQLLKPGQWYCVKRLQVQIGYRELQLHTVMGYDPYISVYNPDNYYYSEFEKVYLENDNFPELVHLPMLRGMFFFLAAFGIVKIAYTAPKNETFQNKKLPYLSVYDGLEYVCLTELGGVLTGALEACTFEAKHNKALVTLDEKRLYIYTDSDDEITDMLLKMIADKINNRCYKVSYQSFLRDCFSQADVKNRVIFFKENVAVKPPSIWVNFLHEVIFKIDPLEPEEEYSVFQVRESPELLSLLSRDETLKKYVLKAEGYKILVLKKDFRKVKKRLEEFGFLITL